VGASRRAPQPERAEARPSGSTRVLNYAYDSVGNRQYEHRDNNLGNDDFDYDLNNQFTDFTRSATLGSNSTSAFTFDASGNRSKLVKDGVTTNCKLPPFSFDNMTIASSDPVFALLREMSNV
jgi:hypothetical protein